MWGERKGRKNVRRGDRTNTNIASRRKRGGVCVCVGGRETEMETETDKETTLDKGENTE